MMKRPPKVTRIEFADGKVVRFRQEGGNLLIEWKNKGCDWKALEPVALEPFVPEMTTVEQAAMAATGAPPAFREAAWVEEYRERFWASNNVVMQQQLRREMERDLVTGRGRVLPRQPNQGAVVDFATITSSMPEPQMRVSGFQTDEGDYPSMNLSGGGSDRD